MKMSIALNYLSMKMSIALLNVTSSSIIFFDLILFDAYQHIVNKSAVTLVVN